MAIPTRGFAKRQCSVKKPRPALHTVTLQNKHQQNHILSCTKVGQNQQAHQPILVRSMKPWFSPSKSSMGLSKVLEPTRPEPGPLLAQALGFLFLRSCFLFFGLPPPQRGEPVRFSRWPRRRKTRSATRSGRFKPRSEHWLTSGQRYSIISTQKNYQHLRT